jgi:hypothetical protein
MVLAVLHGDKVTVRRQVSTDLEGQTNFEEIQEQDGSPVELLVRLERRTVRAYRQGGVEKTGDATMVFKTRDDDIPHETDLVVTEGTATRPSQTFKVESIEDDRLLGTPTRFSRATLSLTRTEVPATSHTEPED